MKAWCQGLREDLLVGGNYVCPLTGGLLNWQAGIRQSGVVSKIDCAKLMGTSLLAGTFN